MRIPVRSETDAFNIAIGGAVLIGASIALGAAAGEVAGVALFVGGVGGAAIWDLRTRDPDRPRSLREAAAQGPRAVPASRRRVLVIANRTLVGDELRGLLRRRAEGGARFHVVAPILASRVHYLASDIDQELDDARARLAATLDWAAAEGLEASGAVGDPNAALGAIEDELRLYGADEVIISTHPPGKSNWLETGIVERLREELNIPITHVVVDLDRAWVMAEASQA
jgi:GABA permease